jgi:hypothetical protein
MKKFKYRRIRGDEGLCVGDEIYGFDDTRQAYAWRTIVPVLIPLYPSEYKYNHLFRRKLYNIYNMLP